MGAKCVAEALKKNRCLEKLFLGTNPTGSEGAKHLAGSLEKNSTLKVLDPFYCYIGDAGVKDFATALKKNVCLKSLKLSVSRSLGEDSAKCLAQALGSNVSLRLCLRTFSMDGNGIKYFEAAMKKNRTLLSLSGIYEGSDFLDNLLDRRVESWLWNGLELTL